MHVYGSNELTRLAGVSPRTLRSLMRAGHIRPRKGARGRLQFSFHDLIILRTARALRAAAIPSRAINRSLRQLQAELPPDVPITGLSITSVGDRIAVREGGAHREADSGQYLLALDVRVEAGECTVFERPARTVTAASPADGADGPVDGVNGANGVGGVNAVDDGDGDGDEHYARAYELEETDAAQALAAYEKCLAANKGHHEGRLNCGRLLHLSGRLSEAERIYRDAERVDAALLFNLAVLLEDLDRLSEAMAAYRQALEDDPSYADAHFNLARLHERAGNQRDALRHLLAYRRLMRAAD